MRLRTLFVAVPVLFGIVSLGCTPQKPVANTPTVTSNTTSAEQAPDVSASDEVSEAEAAVEKQPAPVAA